jgi:glycosyltransferase involved in cell wall biosynthesis
VKVLEAMALGTPVVSTRKGVEGLPVVAGRQALVTDAPASFADAVCRLLVERDLRSSIRENALRLVQAQFDWSLSLRPILTYMEGCASVAAADRP